MQYATAAAVIAVVIARVGRPCHGHVGRPVLRLSVS